MNKPNQLIILGGGTSLREGISKGLWDKLQNTWTFGLNYSYKYFASTCQLFIDDKFYTGQKEELAKLPLIIGRNRQIKTLPNTILLPASNSKYDRDLLCGVYKASLVGIFALSLAIKILDKGEIYLLGYDYSGQGKDNKGRANTHFYQGEINHRGIGKINYYDMKGRAGKDFGVYKDEKKIKIYNVSPKSHINIFDKISYEDFFKKLDKKQYNQDLLRTEIKNKLKGIK